MESEGCDMAQNALYSHQIDLVNKSDDSENLFYIYQHFQDSEKVQEIETESDLLATVDNSLYLYVNNDIDVMTDNIMSDSQPGENIN